MSDSALHEHFRLKKMTDDEFHKLSSFIFSGFGIKMPPEKKTMLQCRLQKRLRVLDIPTFKDYIDFVFSKEGQEQEVIHMIDVVSTNKTDFFREPDHFDYLRDFVLPEFVNNQNNQKLLQVWSAGCSSGEEPYTLSIVLNEFFENYPGYDYSILGTDISTQILKQASEAIYKEEKVDVVPLAIKKKYMLRSKDRDKPTVRIVPELRKKVSFSRLNFMDDHYSVTDCFDVIFCRNVLIYFNRETQERVINKLCGKLKNKGYLFLGHSESITNMNVPLDRLKPTVFRRI
jgi:chemotaxis protein methyltransferase CheR